MKKAIVVDSNDVKALLAERFNVPLENVIKSQYSFTVVVEEPGEGKEVARKDEP